jgi:hypothetical protein
LGDILDSLRQTQAIHGEVARLFYSNQKSQAVAAGRDSKLCMTRCIGCVGFAKIPAASQQLAHFTSILGAPSAARGGVDEVTGRVHKTALTCRFY